MKSKDGPRLSTRLSGSETVMKLPIALASEDWVLDRQIGTRERKEYVKFVKK